MTAIVQLSELPPTELPSGRERKFVCKWLKCFEMFLSAVLDVSAYNLGRLTPNAYRIFFWASLGWGSLVTTSPLFVMG